MVSGTSVGVNSGVSLPVQSAEERDLLMWCPDADFDAAIAGLGMRVSK